MRDSASLPLFGNYLIVEKLEDYTFLGLRESPTSPTSSKGNMKTQEMGVMEERIFVFRFLTKGFVFDNTMTTTLLLCLLFVFIVFQ